jgi:hypothetical protein
MMLAGCGPPRTFEVPPGTRGAVLLAGAEGRKALDGFELFEPGSRTPLKTLATVSSQGLQHKAVAMLTQPFKDVMAGTWRIETPEFDGPLTFELLRSTAPAEGPLSLDIRFLLLSGCVDDEPRVAELLQQATAQLGRYLFMANLQVGTVSIERNVSLNTECDLQGLAVATDPLLIEPAAFTFVVTSQPFFLDSIPAGGYAPVPPTFGRAPGGIGGLRVEPTAFVGDVTYLLGHELGHFTGLAHAVERNGAPDLLDDTPLCTDRSDPNGNGQADGLECGDVFFNLMFWDGSYQQGVKLLSESQIDIMRRAVGLH